MWKKKFVYLLDNLKTFASAQKQSTDALTETKLKNRVDNTCLLQSLNSRKIARTITELRLPSFTKKGVSSIKQKKWTVPLNSEYSN